MGGEPLRHLGKKRLHDPHLIKTAPSKAREAAPTFAELPLTASAEVLALARLVPLASSEPRGLLRSTVRERWRNRWSRSARSCQLAVARTCWRVRPEAQNSAPLS